MVIINTIQIDPPLINSSCAWSSDLQQLKDLYESPFTGGVTTRTATTDGFKENELHAVAFMDGSLTTLNSYAYSPHPLSSYLHWVETIIKSSSPGRGYKPIIISITSSDPTTLKSMLKSIQAVRTRIGENQPGPLRSSSRIAIEINTSCPNIPNASPSGYSFPSLIPLLQVVTEEYSEDTSLTVGLKLPPFVYKEQFIAVLDGIKYLTIKNGIQHKCPIAFFTCTNTLGNSLLYGSQTVDANQGVYAVPTALGGLAGEFLHPLALGNVYTFSELLLQHEYCVMGLDKITIIGVGGVTTKEAVARMRTAGAGVVGCATFFGREGVRAFEILTCTM